MQLIIFLIKINKKYQKKYTIFWYHLSQKNKLVYIRIHTNLVNLIPVIWIILNLLNERKNNINLYRRKYNTNSITKIKTKIKRRKKARKTMNKCNLWFKCIKRFNNSSKINKTQYKTKNIWCIWQMFLLNIINLKK